MKKEFCPCCNHELGLHTEAKNPKGDTKPEPGNFTVCLYCQMILCYQNDLTLIKSFAKELIELSRTNPALMHEIVLAQAYAREYIRLKTIKSN
jgi:hypothetical protein